MLSNYINDLLDFNDHSFTLMPINESSFKWSFLKAGVSKCVEFTYLGVKAGFFSKKRCSKKGYFSDDPVKRNAAYCTFNRFQSIFFLLLPSLELCNSHLTHQDRQSCPWPLVWYICDCLQLVSWIFIKSSSCQSILNFFF